MDLVKEVLEGQKIFYFAPPTKENLVFFRDYEKYETTEWIGKTLFNQWQGIAVVPAGYIHFVYTPLDSISIGGSYLTEDFFKLQFQKSKNEEKKVMYQGFRDVMFCYIEHILIPDVIKIEDSEPVNQAPVSRQISLFIFSRSTFLLYAKKLVELVFYSQMNLYSLSYLHFPESSNNIQYRPRNSTLYRKVHEVQLNLFKKKLTMGECLININFITDETN
ncbi:hypothetical protein CRE_08442 [Caenorhabditis remanei]|uniref:JmjC domain-containing protein n=1 Tax=Caenorhabditis remanei TaxID=31234 RepID=E3N014_CAERE|nr:hypothetical protein CRE_08442 [Caenorhabditis remanei]